MPPHYRDDAGKLVLPLPRGDLRFREITKRGFDLLVALPLLIVAVPVVALAALFVRLESRGSAFFVQRRVGRNSASFRLFKLRTMAQSTSGPAITVGGDPRITRIGRFLRRTRIDELPQLWNVVRGDMSIVGPRPEHPDFVARYPGEWKSLLSVRPGLTDKATIAFADEESLLRNVSAPEAAYVQVVMPAKARISLDGIRRDSLFEDFAVLARTAAAVVAPRRSSGAHPAFDDARVQLTAAAAEVQIAS